LLDIPVEDLGTALLTLAAVTHQQIAFDYRSVEGYKSSALSGTYTVADGLHVLIGAAPFLIRATPSGVLTVTARPAASAADARAVTDQLPLLTNPAVTKGGNSQDEVIVSAERARLAPRVGAFVNEISVLGPWEGLARWRIPVCPQVTGLPLDNGESILERISEVARETGVPLAGEICRPNLFVFVTREPTQLLKEMENRARAATFGHASTADIDQFIATPRVARVWYNSTTATSDSFKAAAGFPPFTQITGTGSLENVTTDWEKASHVTRTTERAFADVYIVIDMDRLQGVAVGQFADYVAMLGLAEIKRGAQVGDAPTILRLFDGAPQAALPRMSDWDQAFIKSVYETDQRVTVQQSEIAQGMLREIVR
jgi:hypothetical protein